MGRGNVKRQHATNAIRRSGVAAGTAIDKPQTREGFAPAYAPDDSLQPNESIAEDSELFALETKVALLQERESMLAVREADLLARRREAAKELRRSRRESEKLDVRLAEIGALMAELAQGVLNSNEILQQHMQSFSITPSTATVANGDDSNSSSDDDASIGMNDELQESMRQLEEENSRLLEEVESLKLQNNDLATSLAQSAVKRSIGNSSDSDATMTWEQRKAMLFRQDHEGCETENVSRDSSNEAEALVASLQCELEAKDKELSQLRELLEQRPPASEGMAVGAAAIAQMMDNDELIVEERKRLQELQIEWESKFREIEIASSIERATLARDRQQLERKNAELEEQLAHLKQELRQEEIAGPNQSRRWLAKLGLAE